MIEKALKESLKNTSTKPSSSKLNTTGPDSSHDLSQHHSIVKGTTLGNCSQQNVAKKSAIPHNKLLLSVAAETKHKKISKSSHKHKDQVTKDPVYNPCLSAPVTDLPSKPRFERDSKAITNIMLNLSAADSDSDSAASSTSSSVTSSSSSSCLGNEKVIVISDTSDDFSDSSDEDTTIEKKPRFVHSMIRNL